ncbi:MAG: MFS transporter [Candidatus Marsarchaeota archaeon]|nr:MFS transporter [Candidatus Marsarchaeota archaeon]MCL5413268.1 MFS transporter [Candidatus Marsarchaeota archaeon]
MNNETGNAKNQFRWMYPYLVFSIAAGPLTTLIQLYILRVGGGVLDVSYAITFASAITIPAVFFWGIVTDFVDKRKAFLVLAYLITAILIASLLFITSVFGIIVIYTLIAFIGAATAAPLELLVMETVQKRRWSHNFSVLQALGSAGMVAGLVMAWIITGQSDLGLLIIALAIVAFASAGLAAGLMSEPRRAHKRLSLSGRIHLFVYRLIGLPHVLVRIPNPGDLKDAFGFGRRVKVKRNFVPMFYAASFIFFFGSSIFNTEYPVGLEFFNVSSSAIFFIMLFAMIIQSIVFWYYGRFAAHRKRYWVASASLFLRGIAYVAIGMMFIYLSGLLFEFSNLIIYSIAAGMAYAVYYTTAYSLFFNTLSAKGRGTAIGIYTAIAGIGTFTGALASGNAVIAHGFGDTFIIAGLFMFLGSYIFESLPRSNVVVRPRPSG